MKGLKKGQEVTNGQKGEASTKAKGSMDTHQTNRKCGGLEGKGMETNKLNEGKDAIMREAQPLNKVVGGVVDGGESFNVLNEKGHETRGRLEYQGEEMAKSTWKR